MVIKAGAGSRVQVSSQTRQQARKRVHLINTVTLTAQSPKPAKTLQTLIVMARGLPIPACSLVVAARQEADPQSC